MVLRINLKWKQLLICLIPLFQVSSSFVLTLRMVESSFLWFMTDNCDSMTRDSYRFDPQSPSTFSMYFCTGSVSKVPLGSYCFHQNPQNGFIYLFYFSFSPILFINYFTILFSL